MKVQEIWPLLSSAVEMVLAHPDWSRDEIAYELAVLWVSCPFDVALHYVKTAQDLLESDVPSVGSEMF